MNLKDLTNFSVEDPWWQILICCDDQQIDVNLPTLLQSIDYFSPGARVVVATTSETGNSKLIALLSKIETKLFSTHIIHLDASSFPTNKVNLIRLQAAKQLLELTRLPVLSILPDSLVVRDLSLLPVHLQKCDVAVRLRLKKKRGSLRVFSNTLWLRANERTRVFLDRTSMHLANTKNKTNSDEKNSIYNALVECRDFLKVTDLHSTYADWSLQNTSYIWSGLAGNKIDKTDANHKISHLKRLTEAEPDTLVFAPRQDIGTKFGLKNNSYKIRSARLARPGRIYWRHAARVVGSVQEFSGSRCRIVSIPQWQINYDLLEAYQSIVNFHVPHLVRRQLDHPKARFYMQEFLPMLFTMDPNGWGASSNAYLSKTFEHCDADPRVAGLISEIRITGLTKAPQNVRTDSVVSGFDLLAPLQVPNDDALVYHSDTSLEEFVEALAEFAEAEKVNTLIRKHPYDLTDFYEKAKRKFSSSYVQFGEHGHIHECIRKSKAVCVINSGVGFEAMTLGKPVLSFGRSVYDPVVHDARTNGVANAYRVAVEEPEQKRLERYEKFISWYVYRFGLKLDEQELNFSPERCHSEEMRGENLFYSEIQDELMSELRGRGLAKLPNERPLCRTQANVQHRLERSKKLANRAFKRLNKRTLNKANSKSKKLLMSPFDGNKLSGKKIALVGNASSLRESALGAEIDSHEIVIRMNLGYPLIARKDVDAEQIPADWLQGTFVDRKSSELDKLVILKPDTPDDIAARFCNTAALGRKTDIWSCSTSDKSRQSFFVPLFGARTVACHPNFHHLGFRFILGNKIEYLPEEIVSNLRSKLGIEPTSGLIWLEYVYRQNIGSLSLYGFDFFQSGHIARRSKNVLQATGKWPHDPEIEKQYVMDLVAQSGGKIHIT